MIVFQYVSGFSADRWRDDAEATAVQSLLSRLFFYLFILIFFVFLRLEKVKLISLRIEEDYGR
jgi:hypothetical protein